MSALGGKADLPGAMALGPLLTLCGRSPTRYRRGAGISMTAAGCRSSGPASIGRSEHGRKHHVADSRRRHNHGNHRERARRHGAGAAAGCAALATIKVTDNVYIFRYGNHQSMFIVTPAGVIATDPISERRPAKPYIDAIQAVTKAPIKYVIYSHSHFDHIAGGKPFKELGATFVAHA